MKVHELLSKRDRWTQGALARRADGSALFDMDSPEACCWCLVGALAHCYPKGEDQLEVSRKIYERLGDDSMSNFNDNGTYEEVLALVKELDV